MWGRGASVVSLLTLNLLWFLVSLQFTRICKIWKFNNICKIWITCGKSLWKFPQKVNVNNLILRVEILASHQRLRTCWCIKLYTRLIETECLFCRFKLENLNELSKNLKSLNIAHKLWVEQPENIATCIATIVGRTQLRFILKALLYRGACAFQAKIVLMIITFLTCRFFFLQPAKRSVLKSSFRSFQLFSGQDKND